ncbi:MAG: nucleotidyl transferase AbiEii/AbiGii toxin family protein [Candidatus Peribacter sp.]|nr:nucleotidyl transferase AbiEii/AbiGii toxin family protein [Candidatus Peribacter sp.]
MSDLHLEILRQPQRELWDVFQRESTLIRSQGFYLAGGTALALQLGHRESQDFDFFSQSTDIEPMRAWLDRFPGLLIRDTDARTIHAEITGVKVSFIAGYRYPLVSPSVTAGSIEMADIVDIALMKMLAITHRATLRDYIDLAAILRDRLSLKQLMEMSTRKYGATFNVMLSLRSMVHFEDVDEEMPVMLDHSLGASWKDILRDAVRNAAE